MRRPDAVELCLRRRLDEFWADRALVIDVLDARAGGSTAPGCWLSAGRSGSTALWSFSRPRGERLIRLSVRLAGVVERLSRSREGLVLLAERLIRLIEAKGVFWSG
jgi:hypothetical protein